MNFLLLTKSETFIIGPVAEVLGWIMNQLFNICSTLGVANIGLSIILFTLITKLLMFPLTIKQQKSSKLMSIMNPEIQAIQKKYKGKTDQLSMQKQQAEIQDVYAKYGTSATGGCLQLLIQMPIMLALYQVIAKVPAYVTGVREVFMEVVVRLQAQPDLFNTISELAQSKQMANIDVANADKLVDLLYKFTRADWNTLAGLFPNLSADIIEQSSKIIKMNNFLGLSLMEAPGFKLSIALIIPVLAGLTQWISTKLMSSTQQTDPDSPTAASMKTMNTMMPLMSAFFCVTFPIGIGLYWIATSAFQIIQQLIVNSYMDKIDIEDMIAKNLEKANKKRAKKGLPPQSVSKAVKNSLNKPSAEPQEEEKKAVIEQKVKESTEFYNNTFENPNSLASRAKMVKKYNEKNNK